MPRIGLGVARDGLAGVAALAFTRALRSRLFISQRAHAHLQLDIEQTPDRRNAIALTREIDIYGRHTASVHWQVGDADRTAIETVSSRFVARWPADALRGVRLRLTRGPAGESPKPHDAYHPVGVCRMGTDEGATVDLDLKVRGTGNLFVLSTGVFPSAGTANPTFSVCCAWETGSASTSQPWWRRGARTFRCVPIDRDRNGERATGGGDPYL